MTGVALVALTLVSGVWFLGKRAPAEEPTRLLSELVLVEGRLTVAGSPDEIFNGWVLERYPDGELKSRSRVLAGRLQGVSEGWYPDGRLQVREHFADGVAEGSVTKWHPDGNRLSEGFARGGRLDGIFRRWHDNGVLAEEVSLHRGEPHGLSRAYYPSGFLKAEVRLENGRVLDQRFWDDGETPAPAPAAALARSSTPSGGR